MKKKFAWITALFLLLTSVLPVRAETVRAELNKAVFRSYPEYNFHMRYSNSKSYAGPMEAYTVDKGDGHKTAFCVDLGIGAAAGSNYSTDPHPYEKYLASVPHLTLRMGLAGYLGFLQSPGRVEDVAFTQLYIWDLILRETTNHYGSYQNSVGRKVVSVTFTNQNTVKRYLAWKKNLDQEIDQILYGHPEFSSLPKSLRPGQELVLKDQKNWLQNYRVLRVGGAVLASVKGNDLHIKVSPNAKAGDKISLELVGKKLEDSILKTPTYFYHNVNAKTQIVTHVGLAGFHDPLVQNLSFTIQEPKGHLRVLKVDDVSKEPLPKAQFQLLDSKGRRMAAFLKTPGDEPVYTCDREGDRYTLETGKKGSFRLEGVPTGDYILRETLAPKKYLVLSKDTKVTLQENKTSQVTIGNRKKTGAFNLWKRDAESGDFLFPAVFELLQGEEKVPVSFVEERDGMRVYRYDKASQDNRIEVGKTGKNRGKLRVENLPFGKYSVVEIQAPQGYELKSDKVDVHIVENKDFTWVPFNNRKDMTELEVLKLDAKTKEGLSQAVFQLKDSAGKVLRFEKSPSGAYRPAEGGEVDLVTGDSGRLHVIRLEPGSYTLKEIQAPPGYLLNPKTRDVTLISSEKKTEEFLNQKIPEKTTLALQKKSILPSDYSLKGAAFEVYLRELEEEVEGWEIGSLVDTLRTDADGYAESKPLPLGIYEVVEKEAPSFYEKNPVPLKIQLLKEESQLQSKVLNSNWQGAYRLVEEKWSSWQEKLSQGKYDRASDLLEELLPEEEGIFYETPKRSYFELIKKRETLLEGSTLKRQVQPETGTTFEVFSESQLVDRLTTNEEGRAISKLLPYGEYLVKQVDGPDDTYKVEDFIVRVGEGVPLTYEKLNVSKQSRLRIAKRDGITKKKLPIAGIEFKLYSSATSDVPLKMGGVDVFATDDQGEILFPEALPPGVYYLEELPGEPNGYYLNAEKDRLEIVIRGEEEEVLFEVDNLPQMAKLSIDKRGPQLVRIDKEEREVGSFKYILHTPIFEERGLKGVRFGLYAQEDILGKDGTLHYKKDEKVATLITDEEGRAETDEIPLGAYRLVEEETAQGFQLLEEPLYLSFTELDRDQSVQTVSKTLKNQRKTRTIRFSKRFQPSLFAENPERETYFGLFALDGQVEGWDLPKNSLWDLTTPNEESEVLFQIPFFANWVIRELATHPSYELGDPIPLPEGEEEEVELPEQLNQLKKGRIQLLKLDAKTKKPLQGVEFALFAKENEIARKRTDAAGRLSFENLEYGNYVLRETETREGYLKIEEPIQVELSEKKPVFEQTLENEKEPVKPKEPAPKPKKPKRSTPSKLGVPTATSFSGLFLALGGLLALEWKKRKKK